MSLVTSRLAFEPFNTCVPGAVGCAMHTSGGRAGRAIG